MSPLVVPMAKRTEKASYPSKMEVFREVDDGREEKTLSDKERPTSEYLEWMQYTSQALAHWGLEDADTKLLSLSENATYLVRAAGEDEPYVLRLHRPGFRSGANVRSEIVWLEALITGGVVDTAEVIPTLAGDGCCTFVNPDGIEQYAVLFRFLEGHEPLDEGLSRVIERIGAVAAHLHNHAKSWELPADFERVRWHTESIIGAECSWGDWRRVPEVDAETRAVLEAVEIKIRTEMAEYGMTAGNYGLIHGDLRSSNLLIDDSGSVKVIDFDDCGFGWYLYDMACTFSFEEASPELTSWVYSWLKGYRPAGGPIRDAEFVYLPAMIMARRLLLIAWTEQRRETPYAQEIRKTYVKETLPIARAYLDGEFLQRITAEAVNGTLTQTVEGIT